MKTTVLKSDIHALIDNTSDSNVLNLVYSILSKLKTIKSDAVVLSASEKKAVDKALKSVKRGQVLDHKKVMTEMRKKYPSLIK